MGAADWIPLRWPAGPLDVERARRPESAPAVDAELLGAWCDPRMLELVAGSAVSCLVVTWAEGSSTDESQQRALGPLIAAARERGIAVVGWVGEKAELRRAASTGSAAGLLALATESADAVSGFEVLRFHDRSLKDRSASGFRGVSGMLWPGIRMDSNPGADAASGPTGPPWLDSNAWYVRLCRTLLGSQALWLGFDPPEIGQSLPADAYLQAIADSAVYGGRWLISLDPHLRRGLAERREASLATWAEVARGLGFFEAHRAWASYVPVEQLGVVSDYEGANEFLSFEVLNLLARQGSLYRIVDKRGALAASFDGLDAVLYVDGEPPDKELARKLEAFADAGGTLITPPGWAERGVPEESAWLPRFRVFRSGRGRRAVSRAELRDPYLLADDAQLLMSHRHDRVRVFNPGTAQFHYAASGDGKSGIVHALRFDTPDRRQPLTLWFERTWASGRAWTLDGAEPVPVQRSGAERGVEFTLAPLPSYSALELFL